jgi:hypothetical protein
MKTQLKCSNCVAEVSNLNFGWDKKQWLWWSIPFLVFIIAIPFIMELLMRDNSDFRVDLSLGNIEKQYTDGTIEIIGVIENKGEVDWDNIIVQAELFSAEGKFLDELTRRIYTKLSPGASEYFQIQSEDFPKERWEATKEIQVKVSDANHPRR